MDERELIRSARIADVSRGEIKGVGPSVLSRLVTFERKLADIGFEGGLPAWLANSNKSLKSLGREVGVLDKAIAKVFDHYAIPRLSQAEAAAQFMRELKLNQEVVARTTEVGRATLQRIHADPVLETKRKEAALEGYRKPESKQRRIEGLKRSWIGANKRKEVLSKRSSEQMTALWNSSENRARIIASLLAAWRDPERREQRAEILRKVRLDPQNIGRYHLITVAGFREDIGFYAQSTWEANLARVLICCGREFSSRVGFLLSVPEEYRNIFLSSTTQLSVDFLIRDPRGKTVIYEIMAHPFEDPVGWAKIDILSRQHTDLSIHLVTEKVYNRLRKRFQGRVDSNPLLFGWETYEDNLHTNPEKFRSRL